MSEVGERIRLRDSEATKKWCVDNDVTVHKLSKKDYVYRIDLEYTIGKPFVSDLQKKHPSNWKYLLKDILGNDALYNLFLANLGESRNDAAFSVVKPTNEKEKELFEKLIA
jgi:hypothetical protein